MRLVFAVVIPYPCVRVVLSSRFLAHVVLPLLQKRRFSLHAHMLTRLAHALRNFAIYVSARTHGNLFVSSGFEMWLRLFVM